jgi:hypothetical protein
MAKVKRPQGRNQQPRQQNQQRQKGRPKQRAYVRQRPWWSTPWAMAAVVVALLVVVGGFLVWGNVFQQAPQKPRNDAQIIRQVTHVSPGVYDQVPPQSLTLHKIPGASVTKSPDGKVEFLYMGAEFCPYCAAERWSIIAALSRFGTFSGLQLTTSAGAPEAYPNTPTFSFRNEKYTSDAVTFTSVELTDRDHNTLQTPTPQEQATMNQLDSTGSIPFMVVGGQYTNTAGPGYQVDVLQGQSWSDIAGNLSNPSAASTKAILGEANMLTAAICETNGGTPSNVCQSTAVKKAEAKLQ